MSDSQVQVDPAILQALRAEQDDFILSVAAMGTSATGRILDDERYSALVEPRAGFDPVIWSAVVDAPAVFIEAERTRLERTDFLVDPPWIGEPLSFEEYTEQWRLFAGLTLQTTEGMSEWATFLIERAIQSAAHDHGYTARECQALVDRMWRERWIIDAFSCARIRFRALAATGDELRAAVEPELDRCCDEMLQRLAEIKRNVTSLDEWFEELYLFEPLAQEALILSAESHSTDANRWNRMADEICADIGTVFATSLEAVLDGNPTYWTDEHLRKPIAEAGGDHDELSHRLSYDCNARVFFPQYWLHEALDWARGDPTGEPPGHLDDFDVRHLLSIALTSAPSFVEDFVFGLRE